MLGPHRGIVLPGFVRSEWSLNFDLTKESNLVMHSNFELSKWLTTAKFRNYVEKIWKMSIWLCEVSTVMLLKQKNTLNFLVALSSTTSLLLTPEGGQKRHICIWHVDHKLKFFGN